MQEGERALRRARRPAREQFQAARAVLGHVFARRPRRTIPEHTLTLPLGGRSGTPTASKSTETETMVRNANVKRCNSALYVPSMLCPIGLDVFRDPVLAEDGFSYERAALTRWLETRSTSPMTGAPMGGRLVPNHHLRMAIDEYTSRAWVHPHPSMLCPIGLEVFADPVVAEDGFSYERAALTRWLRMRCISPMTGAPMGGRLLPNHHLRMSIDEYMALWVHPPQTHKV